MGDYASVDMKGDLLRVLSRSATTQLALESLRRNDVAQALELLEFDLDAIVVSLSILSKDLAPDERESVITALRGIRAYRRVHPRRTEADLSSLASGLLVRASDLGGGKAREILEGIE